MTLPLALFGDEEKFTQFGASYTIEPDCFMTIKNDLTIPPRVTEKCLVTLVVIAATDSYTNKEGVSKCNTEINFGGGLCSPDLNSKTLEFYRVFDNLREYGFSKF